MVLIGFDSPDVGKKAADFLKGRFTYIVAENGDLILSENALGPLAANGFQFRAKGPVEQAKKPRPVGQTLPGEIKVPDEAFAPLTPEELKEWGL